MALVLRESRIHSCGCYTTTPIRKGTLVVEYVGERLSNEQADDLYDDVPMTYLFGLDTGKHVVDGYGVAAFINHCCQPNCETDIIGGRIWIIAARDIEAGEELTYDYNLFDGDPGERAPCYCGLKGCRKTMFSEEEVARQKKVLRRRKKRREAARLRQQKTGR